MTWKEILKARISGKLRRYMAYSKASQHNIRDRMSMETIAERVHSRLRQIMSIYGVEKPIEKEIFDEINQMDEEDPKCHLIFLFPTKNTWKNMGMKFK